MLTRLARTRTLQIGTLALLAVSAGQVLWWLLDQERLTRQLTSRYEELYEGDRLAAELLVERGVEQTEIRRLYPHLVLVGQQVAVDPEALVAIHQERHRRLNQYAWEGGFFLLVLGVSMAILWRALRQEAELRRRQDNFLAAVSHELKSPLASLRLSAETLTLREPSAASLERLLPRMLHDLGRMEGLVTKLLDTARLQEARMHMQPEPTPLGEVVASVVGEQQHRAERQEVVLEVAVSPELVVQADTLAARSVVSNLVENAIKATAAKGGGRVRIAAARAGDRIELSVADDGVGFHPSESIKLFEKFYRPGDELRRTSTGSGLGLYLVAQMMALDHGRVEAYSDGAGRGATFTVSWPLAASETAS